MPIKMDIDIQDDTSDTLKWMIATKPDWLRKVMKSVGWMVQKEIKKGVKSGSPGGQAYAARMDPSRRAELDQGRGVKGTIFPWMGDLQKAVGYQYQDGKVTIGWLSATAVYDGSKLEKGVNYAVTEKMRRWFFWKGIPLGKNTTSILVPKRPTFEPELNTVSPLIAPYIDQKIAEYLANGPPGSGSGKRKYRVYG
jgi:hypothetical protein